MATAPASGGVEEGAGRHTPPNQPMSTRAEQLASSQLPRHGGRAAAADGGTVPGGV